MTLDGHTLKRVADEVARELGLNCKVVEAKQLMGSTTWYLVFDDGHGPFFNDFRAWVGAPYEESFIRQRIRDYLLREHAHENGKR